MTPETPGLHTRCAITVASLLLLLAPAPVAYAADEPKAPEKSPKPTASASLAGRQAGEGRPRPGRQVTPSPSTSTTPSATPSRTPAAAVPPSASATAAKSSRPASPSRSAEGRPTRDGEPSADTLPPEDEALESDEPGDAWVAPTPAPDRSEPAAARHQAPQGTPVPVAQEISPLSLGVGMALMGLGIGFLGVRLRRR
ncbi:hypothetical protein ACWD01_05205 [Streptomyces sp. NPDC002835]